MNTTVMVILLVGLVASAMTCILIRNLLKASIALAAMSAILSITMYLMDAPLAAVFELSVCAGLITVVFISAISMTRVRSKEEIAEKERKRRIRFYALPVVLVLVLAGALFALWPRVNDLLPYATVADGAAETAQSFIWNKRQGDLLGQIVIVLAGVTGVLIFFREGDAS